MKTAVNYFFPEKEKEIEKLNNAVDAAGSREYFEAFKAELSQSDVSDYPKCKFVVTHSFYASYNDKKYVTIRPLEKVVNVYSSNMINGQYDYTWKYLCIESNDHTHAYFAAVSRNAKTLDFDALLKFLTYQCKNNEGSLMAEVM